MILVLLCWQIEPTCCISCNILHHVPYNYPVKSNLFIEWNLICKVCVTNLNIIQMIIFVNTLCSDMFIKDIHLCGVDKYCCHLSGWCYCPHTWLDLSRPHYHSLFTDDLIRSLGCDRVFVRYFSSVTCLIKKQLGIGLFDNWKIWIIYILILITIPRKCVYLFLVILFIMYKYDKYTMKKMV